MTVLNWSRHSVGKRFGLCRYGSRCVAHDDAGRGGPALMRDEHGQPTHKVCAEAAAAGDNERAAAAYSAAVHIGQAGEVGERPLGSPGRRRG